jgi:hypothetical protein
LALRPTRLTVPLAALALAFVAPSAAAAAPLPEPRTHVDAAGEGPRLTLLVADTSTRDIRRGYLYVKARCSQRCVVEVTASTKIGGKQREVASRSRTLPARRVRRIRLRIRSDVRRRIAAGARFRFRAVPYPPY